MQTRSNAVTSGDATWFAYAVYGHPHAPLK
jgi:hypothetical protein